MVERDRELDSIGAALGAARNGRGGLLFIEANAGLGKTELLASAAQQAAGQGMDVLAARGSELECEHAFGLAVQLLEPPLNHAGESERRELLDGAAALASPLFEGRAAPVSSSDDQRFALLHGLQWLTSNLAERRPLLITADDVHWSDRLSLRFFLFLAQRIGDLPVALMVSARRAEHGAPQDLLRQIEAHEAAELLRPAPLSAAGVSRLVISQMAEAEEEFVSACGGVTGGNPHLLRELLTDLKHRGIEPIATNAPEVGRLAPDSVLQAAALRLSRLPAAALPLARAVAVLSEEATLRRAATLAGLDGDSAGDAADALVGGEILRPGEPLAFVHPLLQSAIRADIPAENRARAHGRAARMLADDGLGPETVSGHLLAARRAGDPWVVEQLRAAAARSLTGGGVDSATRYLARALEEPPAPAVRTEALLELARAESLAGRGEPIALLDRALESIDDPIHRAQVFGELGWTLQKRGLLAEAADAFERGLTEIEPDTNTSLGNDLQCAYLGAAFLVGDRGPEAHAKIETILAEPSSGITEAEHGLLSMAATSHVFASEAHEEVVSLCTKALGGGALIEKQGSDSPIVWHVIGCLSWSDELDLSEQAVEAALADARNRGSVATLALGFYARSWPRYWRGRLKEAAGDAQAAVDAWSGDFSMYLPVAAHWLACSLLELGDIDAAVTATDYPDAEDRWGSTNMYGMLKAAEGRIARARGDHAEALEDFLAAGRSALGSVMANPAVLSWRSDGALAAAAIGDFDQAGRLAEEELVLSRRFGAPRALGVALRAAGLVEGGERGVELLAEAVRILERSPAKLELARALVDLGAATRRQHSPTKARQPLREGLAMAQRFGAVPLERRALEELLASGARPRRRELSGIESLTPSELRVARMAAGGMTNREIAQELFVTVKAVKWHLSHTYRKLELSGREQLRHALRTGRG